MKCQRHCPTGVTERCTGKSSGQGVAGWARRKARDTITVTGPLSPHLPRLLGAACSRGSLPQDLCTTGPLLVPKNAFRGLTEKNQVTYLLLPLPYVLQNVGKLFNNHGNLKTE